MVFKKGLPTDNMLWVRRGLTLVEIVVVLTILGMLMTITAVSISNFIRPPPKDITENIKAALRYAYQTAILNNQTVLFVLDKEQNKYLVIKLDRTDSGLEEKVLIESVLPSNLQIIKVMDLRGIVYESEKIKIPFNRNGVSENFDIHLGEEGNVLYTLMVYKFNGKVEVFPGEKSRAEELSIDKDSEKKRQEELELLFQ